MSGEFTGSFPYAGGSGTRRIETSQEREYNDDTNGRTLTLQQRVLKIVLASGARGVTGLEIRKNDPSFHNPGVALTALHKDGQIVRLAKKRRIGDRGNRAYVYVDHQFVNGRETLPFVPQGAHFSSEEAIYRAKRLADFLDARVAGTAETHPTTETQPGDKEVALALRYLIYQSETHKGHRKVSSRYKDKRGNQDTKKS